MIWLTRTLDRALAFGRLAAPEVMRPFHQPVTPASALLRRFFFFSLCAVAGMSYGFWGTVLPPAFIIFLGVPPLILVMLVFWMLPETNAAPTPWFGRLLLLFALAVVAWPNYLAFSLPGLPWLSIRRLVGIPLVLVILFTLSTRPQVRERLVDVYRDSDLIVKFLFIFVLTQLLSMILSDNLIVSYKLWFNNQYSWTAIFFASSFYFLQNRNIIKWCTALLWAAVVVSLIAVAEQRNQMVLWAQHIPSFLKVEDDVVATILTPEFRQGMYRSQSIFTVPLALAEFLTMMTPLLTHRIVTSKSNSERLFGLAAMILIITAIFFTRARLGFVAFIIGHAIYALIYGIRDWRDNRGGVLGPALTLGYPGILLATTALVLSVDALRFRIVGNSNTAGSDDARADQFAMAPPVFMDSPIFGHGQGNGATALGYINPGGSLTIDTYVLTVALDYGIIGFIGFFGAIITAIAVGLSLAIAEQNNPAKGRDDIGYLLPISIMLLEFLVIKTVLSQEENHSIAFMLLGAIVALVYRTKKSPAVSTLG